MPSAKAVEILSKEDLDEYNVSVVLMTDGASNDGSIYDLKSVYNKVGKDIPVFSIMFGSALSDQLEDVH